MPVQDLPTQNWSGLVKYTQASFDLITFWHNKNNIKTTTTTE